MGNASSLPMSSPIPVAGGGVSITHDIELGKQIAHSGKYPAGSNGLDEAFVTDVTDKNDHGVALAIEEFASVTPALLDDVRLFLARFVVYPSTSALIAHVLWIAHTWLMDAWESTPRIAFLSPEPGSGKSRALEVTEPLVPRLVHAVNTTLTALIESPQVCSLKFLTCEQRSL